MTQDRPRALWSGRLLAFLGIVLVAVNLRTAVAALSPLVDQIDAEIGLDAVGLGLLGMLPPLCFALFGLLTPRIVRGRRLEPVLVVALVVLMSGHLVRSSAPSFAQLALGSALCFAGMGVGNVVLPPLVKKYFPDRIGAMTALYATVLSISTLVPPLIAVPVARASSWHLSLGIWSALAALAVLPWVLQLLRERRRLVEITPAVAAPQTLVRVTRSRIAWCLAVLFMSSSVSAYSMFAWLPTLLREVAGVDEAQAGALLSLYAAMGLPSAVVIPLIAARTRHLLAIIWLSVVCFVTGYGGLLLAPAAAPALWVALAGAGPLLFPLALVLINLRTASHAGAVALSGFVQSLGYAVAALGPLGLGLLHSLTGGWQTGLLVLVAVSLAAGLAGVVVARPGTIEEELAAPQPDS